MCARKLSGHDSSHVKCQEKTVLWDKPALLAKNSLAGANLQLTKPEASGTDA